MESKVAKAMVSEHTSSPPSSKIWDWLTAPAVSITDSEIRLRAQLLSSILVVIIILVPPAIILNLNAADNTNGVMALALGEVGLIVAYTISRTRHYNVAAILTVVTVYFAIFASMFVDLDPTAPFNIALLGMTSLSIILSSFLLTTWWTIAMSVMNVLGIVLGILVAPILESNAAIWTPVFVVIVGALSTLVSVLRQRDQQRIGGQLTELQQARDDLERRATSEQKIREQLESSVGEYRDFILRVAEGDLSQRLALNGENLDTAANGPVRSLGQHLNIMVDSLGNLSDRVRKIAGQVMEASNEILAASNQQSASANQQDAAITQTMATVEEVQNTVEQTAIRARSVADLSLKSVDVSRTGQQAVAETVEGMAAVQTQVYDIAQTILELSERTQLIGEITATVKEIADQSKLLALNASIEAARAGEEGRGFSVVAMEVRQLAEQSQQATTRIANILNEIQQLTNTAVMVTEEGSKTADKGVTLANLTGTAIQDLAAMIEQSEQAANQIAASTYQQTNGMEQLTTAMMSIKQATNQTAASTRQAEQSAKDLNDMARQMEDVVARYRL